ncbi:hypothetical protein [Agrococcus beijingensis]|uniref:hypothetical protein n=1 Tax=Agrococcus beijingensis TaxID=3068634 RepID=UPI0027408CBD|nr:hypothetical protein [Agrococcus sp. REN33]
MEIISASLAALAKAEPLEAGKVATRVLSHDAAATIIHVGLGAGGELDDHRVPGPILLVGLDGTATVTEGEACAQIEAGGMLRIDEHVIHRLRSDEGANVLLVRLPKAAG